MYIAIDGNDVGKHLEGLILSGDLEGLHAFSLKITFLINTIEQFIIKQGGKCFLRGGDNILAYIMQDKLMVIVKYISTLKTDDISFSIGIGNDVIDAYLALKYAKSMKKGYICRKDNNNFNIITF